MATANVKKLDKTADADRLDGAVKKMKLELLNDAPMDAAAKELKINLPSNANPKTKATALVAYFIQHTVAVDLVECDTCSGPSDINLDNCPYCGSSGDAVSVGAPEEGGAPEVDAPAADVAKGKAAKKSAKETQVAKKNSTALAKAGTSAPVVTRGPVMTVGDLDQAVAEVKAIAQSAHGYAWKLGDRLKALFDSNKWKLRTGEDGKPAYTKFDQFTKAELGFTRKYAFVLMKVSEHFTESQVQEMGTSKLRLVLEAPKEHQAALLEKVKKGAKKRDIERDLPRNKDKVTRDLQKTPKGEKGKKKTQQITVASVLKRLTVKLFQKPAKKGDEPKPATKLSQVPWGVLDLANDVRMYFQITTTPGGELRLIADTRRVDPEE